MRTTSQSGAWSAATSVSSLFSVSVSQPPSRGAHLPRLSSPAAWPTTEVLGKQRDVSACPTWFQNATAAKKEDPSRPPAPPATHFLSLFSEFMRRGLRTCSSLSDRAGSVSCGPLLLRPLPSSRRTANSMREVQPAAPPKILQRPKHDGWCMLGDWVIVSGSNARKDREPDYVDVFPSLPLSFLMPSWAPGRLYCINPPALV